MHNSDTIKLDNNLLLVYKYQDTLSKNMKYNFLFHVYKNSNNLFENIYMDSIISRTGKVKLRDYNRDGLKDLLVQNHSDVRSNWTYNLYLLKDNSIIKVSNFDKIKNPKYLNDFDLIESYVFSGKNYVEFYKIIGKDICKLDTLMYDDNYTSLEFIKAKKNILKNETDIRCKDF